MTFPSSTTYPGAAIYPGAPLDPAPDSPAARPGTHRLVAYAGLGAPLGVLPWPLSWNASVPISDTGAIQVAYSVLAAKGAIFERPLTQGTEIAVEVSNGTTWLEPDGCRFLVADRKNDLLDDQKVRTAVGPSYLWLASKIRSLNTAALNPEDHSEAGKRPFLSANPGVIVGTLLSEAAAAGMDPFTREFTTATDSNGVPWAHEVTWHVQHGVTLAVLIQQLVAAGACEVTTRGRELVLTNPGGLSPDISGSVRFDAERHMAAAPGDEHIYDLASRFHFSGGEGLQQSWTEVTAPTPWGAWQWHDSSDNITDAGTAQALLQETAKTSGRMRGQYTRDLVTSELTSWPLLSFGAGAWVTAPTNVPAERVRVVEILVRSGDDGEVIPSLILNDRLLDEAERQARRQAGIVGSSTAPGGSTIRPAPGQDKRTPAKPEGLVVQSSAYINQFGYARATVAAECAPVSTARPSDGGGLLEVSQYEWWGRENVAGAPWKRWETTAGPSMQSSPYDVATAYQLRVRARGRYATSPGEWSDIVTFATPDDVTPPPVPSTPVLSTRLGVITVFWDGLGDEGQNMPIDFDRVEVAMSTSPTANPPQSAVIDRLSGKGGAYVTGQPYGANRFFRLRSVDRAGNKSDWSEEADIATQPLVNADAIQLILDGANIEPGTINAADSIIGNTITGALIQGLAVKAVHLDANEIWADNAFLGHARAGVLSVGAVNPKALSFGTDELAPNPMWLDADLRATYPATGSYSYSTTAAGLRKGATHSVRLDGATASINARMYLSPEMPVVPGERHYISMTGRRTTSMDAPLAVQLVGKDTAGVTRFIGDALTSLPQSNPANVFRDTSRIVVIPDEWVSARLCLVATSTPTGGFWYVSQVSWRRAMSSVGDTGEGLEVTPRGIRAWDAAGNVVLDLGNGTGNTVTGELFRTGMPGSGPHVRLTNQVADTGLPALTFNMDLFAQENRNARMLVFPTPTGGGQLWLNSSDNPATAGRFHLVRANYGLEIWQNSETNTALRIGDLGQGDPRWNLSIDKFGVMTWNVGVGGAIEHRVPGGGSVSFIAPGGQQLYGSDFLSGGNYYFRSQAAYDQTTVSSTNLNVNGTGRILRSTSVRAAKVDIDYDRGADFLAAAKALQPVTFRDKATVDRGEDSPIIPGFIAEDVAEINPGLGLATYDENGTLTGVAYDRIPAALVAWLRDHETRLATLEAT